MKKWDKVYLKETFGEMWYPSEGLVRFTARYLQRRVGINVYKIKRKIKRILDAGCGNGRHSIFFAEQGFDVYGIDISKQAIEIVKAWFFKEKLKGHFTVGNVEKLAFQDGFFDAAISYGVLDHILFSRAKKAVKEIKRVLSKGGYFYTSLRSTESSDFGRGKKINQNTFILKEGYEKGLIQHFFNLKEIKELFKGFNIVDIELYEEKFPKVYTSDKHFLQSSKGIKKYLDLSKPLNLNLKDSRWHIVVEKI